MNNDINKLMPFGFRILVKVDKEKIENILSVKLLTGEIIKISKAISEQTECSLMENNNYTAQNMLYSHACLILEEGMEVTFTYSPEVCNIINDNIYNIPIELIRQYKEKDYE